MHRGYRIVIGMATMPEREKHLARTLESLNGQTMPYDAFYLYDNSVEPYNATDNGKFYGLTKEKEPCYYLTCDDDLIYPPTYIEDIVKWVDEFGGVCSLHGRKLHGRHNSYYRAPHEVLMCSHYVAGLHHVHVVGTGVSAWHTSYFNPKSIFKDKRQKMTDLLLSHLAAKQDVPLWVLGHPNNYIQVQYLNPTRTIHGQMHKSDDSVQAQIANQILSIHETNSKQQRSR